jgi:hypothetical protein
MNKRIIRLCLPSVVLALAVAACGLGTSSPGIGSSQEPGGPNSTSQSGSGLCDNPYQPVVESATYSRTSTSSLGQGSYTGTISHVTSTGFDIDRAGTLPSGRTYTSTEVWVCTPDGLAQYLTNDLAAIYTGSNGATVTVSVNTNQGVTLPNSINPGDTWTQHMNADVTGPDSTTNWDVTYDFTALGNETVTVPAGTFTAMKIAFHVTSASQGQTVLEADLDFWAAPGVGLVMSDFTFGGAVQSTTVLTAYNIP